MAGIKIKSSAADDPLVFTITEKAPTRGITGWTDVF